MIRGFIIISLIFAIAFGIIPASAPEAKAIDPVTIAILTPIAIKAAQIMAPYVIRYLKNMAAFSPRLLKPLVNIFKLPIGLIMCVGGWPFRGVFRNGARMTGQGLVAPFQLCWNVLLWPISGFGLFNGR